MFYTAAIAFPKLGLEINPNPVAFSLFGKSIYWYGLIIAVGFILAYVYMTRRAPLYGLTQDDVLDIVLWAVPVGVICARAYYCIFYWEQYADNPISVLYIWQGGLAIYGGIIGGVAAIVTVALRKKIPPMTMLDVAGPAAMIGQIFGRWGNFFNREAFGDYTDSLLAMRLSVDDVSSAVRQSPAYQTMLQKAQEGGYAGFVQVHPTFLYESLWNLVGFVLLHFYAKKRKFDGEVFLLYVAWYGLGRAWIEGLRTDSLLLFSTGIRVSQFVALMSCIAAVLILVLVRTLNKPGSEALFVNRQNRAEEAQKEEQNEEI